MNQNNTDDTGDYGDADDWMMAMRSLSERLLHGLEKLTAQPDAQSLNNLLFIASLQSGVTIEPNVKSLLDTDEIRLLAPRWLRILRDAADALLRSRRRWSGRDSRARRARRYTRPSATHCAPWSRCALAAMQTGGEVL